MPGAMEQVGHAYGSRRRRHLDARKQRMVIYNGVRQENFIDAAAAEIECRSVVKGAPRANAREQPIILAVPKAVNARCVRTLNRCSVYEYFLVRWSGTGIRLRCRRRVWVPAFGRLRLRMDCGYGREQKKCTSHRAPHPFPHIEDACLSFYVSEAQIVGNHGKVVKEERRFRRE